MLFVSSSRRFAVVWRRFGRENKVQQQQPSIYTRVDATHPHRRHPGEKLFATHPPKLQAEPLTREVGVAFARELCRSLSRCLLRWSTQECIFPLRVRTKFEVRSSNAFLCMASEENSNVLFLLQFWLLFTISLQIAQVMCL